MPSNPATQVPAAEVPATEVSAPEVPAVAVAGRRGHVVVVGSLNIDHVISVVQLPRPGETVSGHGYMAVPGGKGLNQAVTAARQRANVVMIGCVGDDTSGERLLQVLNDEGIEADSARRVAGAPSGTALITVATGGANTIVVAPGANHELGPADVEQAGGYFRPGVVVLAQLEVPLAAVTAAFSLAQAQGATTILNPAPAPAPAPGQLPRELLRLVDVITPNETEALAITGATSPEEAAAWFLDRGCGSVALTLGERGALLARIGRPPVLVPTHRVEAVDTTAAGDAFCGSLASALAAGAALDDAVRYGCAAGALATTVMGALPSLPTAAEVERLMSASATVGSGGPVR
jgi:ribokinase